MKLYREAISGDDPTVLTEVMPVVAVPIPWCRYHGSQMYADTGVCYRSMTGAHMSKLCRLEEPQQVYRIEGDTT